MQISFRSVMIVMCIHLAKKSHNNHTAHLVPVVRSEVRVLSSAGRSLTGENESVTAGSIDLHDDGPMKPI